MLVLHTDLDDTLIYSKRRRIIEPKTCVEYYNGEPLSYMLDTSIEKLKQVLNLEDILVVPTTARSKEQFNRINLPDFEFAIVSNGGILLRNGVVDKDWYDYSLSLADSCSDIFKECIKVLKCDVDVYTDIVYNENLFLRTRSNNPEKTVAMLKAWTGEEVGVSIYNLGSKVYVFPSGINKDSAIKRFNGVVDSDFTILADDSMHNYSSSVDLFLTTDTSVLNSNLGNRKLAENMLSEDMLNLVVRDSKNFLRKC